MGGYLTLPVVEVKAQTSNKIKAIIDDDADDDAGRNTHRIVT
jgi:hypothetical protein